MKICGMCKVERPVSDFGKRSSARHDGLQNECLECRRAYNRTYHAGPRHVEHLATIKRNKVDRVKQFQKFIVSYLQEHPCVDCGQTDIRVLDFDHVRGDKLTEVTKMVLNGFGLKKIQAEIAKCEVRCANCHRIQTVTRSGSYRSKYMLAELDGTAAAS